MAVTNTPDQRVRAVFVCSFLGGKPTFEGRGGVLISDPHQLGVKRCQPLGRILSHSLPQYTRNGIDLQKSSKVSFKHAGVATGVGAGWYSAHESDAEHRFTLQKAAVKTQVCPAELCVM